MLNIIIPFYNDSSNVGNAIKSLENQTFKMFVVTVIDDCSSEEESNKLKQILKNSNITYIYEKLETNYGPSVARRTGVNIAFKNNFDYIMFLDSDDMLYPIAAEALYKNAKRKFADVCYSNICVENNSSYDSLKLGKNTTWTHGKIYSTHFLKNNHINFLDNIRYNEDATFNLLVSFMTDKKYDINTVTYLWRNNKNSLTRSDRLGFLKKSNKDYIIGQLDSLKRIIEHYDKLPINLIYTFINIYRAYNNEFKLNKYCPYLFNFLKNLFNFLKTPKITDKIQKLFDDKETKIKLYENLNGLIMLEKEIYTPYFTFKDFMKDKFEIKIN